jgi:Aldehyde dehydrogenase family
VQAAAGNLKKVSLELGGKSPNIVLGEGDLKTAVPGAAHDLFQSPAMLLRRLTALCREQNLRRSGGRCHFNTRFPRKESEFVPADRFSSGLPPITFCQVMILAVGRHFALGGEFPLRLVL